MSTVVTENLKRSSETASRSLRGVAAAWVNFDGTGTVAVRDSQNVSSVTDNGTGLFTGNFTSLMGDASYGMTLTAQIGAFGTPVLSPVSTNQPTTSALPVKANREGPVLADPQIAVAVAHGDLA